MQIRRLPLFCFLVLCQIQLFAQNQESRRTPAPQERRAGKDAPLWAAEHPILTSTTLPSGDKFFALIYFTESLYKLEFFQQPKGAAQQRLWSRTFNSQESAQKFLKSYLHSNPQLTRAPWAPGPLSTMQKFEPETFITENPSQVLWQDTETWTWDWELKYGEWVRQNVKTDFLRKLNIASDCADLAFSVRWIFARIHHLPMASSLSGTNRFITNRSMLKSWQTIPTHSDWTKDQRFFVALAYILDNTYTHSLFNDTYPIRIEPASFLPGTINLAIHAESGHTLLVQRVNEPNEIPLIVLYSNVPKVVRDLTETPFLYADQFPESEGGFRRHRWPEFKDNKVSLVAGPSMPNYSLEQFDPQFMAGEKIFAVAVMKHLNQNFDFGILVNKSLDALIQLIQERLKVVTEGWQVCQRQSCAEGTSNYEAWSTPSRDARILSLGGTVHDLFDVYSVVDPKNYPQAIMNWKQKVEETAVPVLGQNFKLGQLLWVWETNSFSSQPADREALRWGLDGEEIANLNLKRLETLLIERQNRINNQGANCQSDKSCPVGGPEWQKWQTIDLDSRLAEVYNSHQSYCRVFAEIQCQRYRRIIAQRSILGLTANEWLARIPWLSADPNSNLKTRWGEQKNNWQSLALAGSGKFTMSEKRDWILSRRPIDQGAELINSQTGQAFQPTPGYSLLDLQASSQAVAEFQTEGNQINYHFISLTGQDLYHYSLIKNPQAPLFHEWAGSQGLYVIRNGTTLVILDVLAKTATTYEYHGLNQRTLKKIYVVRSPAKADHPDHLRILDLAKDPPLAMDLPWKADDQGSERWLVLDSQRINPDATQVTALACLVSDRDQDCRVGARPLHNFWVDHKTNEFLPWQDDQTKEAREIVRLFSDGKFALTKSLPQKTSSGYESHFQLMKVVSPGHLTLSQDLSSASQYEIPDANFDGFRLTQSEFSFYSEYMIYQGNGRVLTFPHPNQKLFDCFRDQCSVEISESESRLRSLATAESLVESSANLFIDRRLQGSYSLVYSFIDAPNFTMLTYRAAANEGKKTGADLTNIMPDISGDRELYLSSQPDEFVPASSVLIPYRGEDSNQGVIFSVRFPMRRNILSGSRYSTKQSLLLL